MTEIELLQRENQLLRASVEILSKEAANQYQRARGAEYVEARAERIAQNIATAIEQFERFKSEIIGAVHGRLEAERKLMKFKNFRKKKTPKKRKKRK